MPPEMAIYGRGVRSQSISSDRPSLTGYGGLLSPPLSISPDPAFIAASAASQIVTNDHDSQPESWLDQHGIEPSGETALVAPPALKLVNRFLDQILFNFLSVSKSTSLAALRPAVSEVLKPKLAKDAINGADQELHEYLGGGDDEDIMALHNESEASGDWDLELVWKRTRLRCMVYSSLGDMEEEDEDFYTEQDHLDSTTSDGQSSALGVVSPAVAIFLTSILEFVGEQVLVVAGQASYQRLRTKLEKEARDGTSTPADIAERVVVEEFDMERVALDRTLGRLWRGWKKRIRSPTNSISITRSFSKESLFSQPQSSQAASISPDEPMDEELRRPSLAAVLAEYEYAAGIPLPMSVDDIREIEIPGLAAQSDDDETDASSSDDEVQMAPRPKSMIFYDHAVQYPATPTSPLPSVSPIQNPRKRANSLPTPAASPYSLKRQRALVGESAEPGEEEEQQVLETEPKTQDEDPEKEIDSKESPEEGESVITRALAGAAVLGAAAVGGIVAIANGEAPQTSVDSKSEVDPEEEFTEEPQILTSSRISIGGRISPDDLKNVPGEASRRSSIRSHSVHSLRVIDVAKSPTLSRAGSMEANDYIARPVMLSRSNSTHSPLLESQAPRIASPVSRSSNNSPHVLNRPSLTSTPTRNSLGDSILEVEEKEHYESESEIMTAVPADFAAAMQGVDVDLSTISQPFGSSVFPRSKPTPAPFVLAAAPPARHNGEVNGQGNNKENVQPTGRLAFSKTPSAENGVPPLTPLRELMEVAPDTSDEGSSMAPSRDAYSMSEHGINDYSPTASAVSHGQRTGEPMRSIRSQNANIPRSSPPRSTREDSTRRISDQSKTNLSIRTSNSTSSGASQKLVAKRASEDNDSPATIEDKSQSFEQLIRSDQTIQYTLTPENMRNIEAPESPRTLSNTQDVPRPSTTRSRSSSANKTNGLRAHPPTDILKTAPPFKSIPRPVPNLNTASRLRSNAPQPRDARVDRDSIGDFADFIRSTGPANSYEQMPKSVQSHRGTNGTPRNFSGSVPRVASPMSVPRRAESSAGRKKLQARDAVVPRGDSISDLIDFVRSGPQLEKNSHRIPRTVAPFRTTMDSDQMSGAVGGKAIDATIPDARYSQTSASVTSSVTSQSALLKNASMNRPLPNEDVQEFDEEDMMPKRKTRRVKDPYAIDFSDEEEEIQVATRSKPMPKEESLADFLRNVPPPPSPLATSSVFDSVLKPPGKDIRKKSSTPSLMSRFGRNGSGPHSAPKPKSSGNDSRSSIRNGASMHKPITVKHNPAATPWDASHNDNYASQAESARNKVPRKAYQPRDAVLSSTNRTNDLADFLMRSEPPSSVQAQPQTFAPTLQKEEASAFQRMFGRKKVH
ncbi:hypothetical protein G7Y89_g12813 [Cudoniella acicularis]|uniref:Flo11 n=1 Tax=Cudoniella acicularis TaxID=354080 RepID=A0A8H4R826_9HELO|nr:hypothetical protein G7Y89_g12813 [Cudoniella acicularis]